jgi:hypothetical protein
MFHLYFRTEVEKLLGIQAGTPAGFDREIHTNINHICGPVNLPKLRRR